MSLYNMKINDKEILLYQLEMAKPCPCFSQDALVFCRAKIEASLDMFYLYLHTVSSGAMAIHALFINGCHWKSWVGVVGPGFLLPRGSHPASGDHKLSVPVEAFLRGGCECGWPPWVAVLQGVWPCPPLWSLATHCCAFSLFIVGCWSRWTSGTSPATLQPCSGRGWFYHTRPCDLATCRRWLVLLHPLEHWWTRRLHHSWLGSCPQSSSP